MPAKRLREESGYSLVEVLVSIIIMTLAILPMAAMFNAGINSATASSNYDKARMLANQKLEQAKNLPFTDVESNFPVAGNTTPYDDPAAWVAGPDPDFTNFDYRVVKDYMAQPETDPADPSWDFDTSATPTGLIRVAVTVRWVVSNSDDDYSYYTTYGLVAK
jgi:type II secretory pathway pseudopilin PulG